MRMIAQFVGEFHGCFMPTEDCQDGLCPRPWWRTCSSLSQSLLLFLFSSLASCPGLLTFPAFPISQPVSYFILHPASSPSPSPQSQWPYPSQSLSPSPCEAPGPQTPSPCPPIFVPVLVSSTFEVGTSFSVQPGHRNVERPGQTDSMSSIRAPRATLATSNKTW